MNLLSVTTDATDLPSASRGDRAAQPFRSKDFRSLEDPEYQNDEVGGAA
jgi:hypothetical protein